MEGESERFRACLLSRAILTDYGSTPSPSAISFLMSLNNEIVSLGGVVFAEGIQPLPAFC